MAFIKIAVLLICFDWHFLAPS